MRKTAERVRPERRISCRRHQETVVIDLSADDDQELFYLTHHEARLLAADLEAMFLGSQIQMMLERNPRRTFNVADVLLTPGDVWELWVALEEFFEREVEVISTAGHRMARVSSGVADRVDWLKEGF